MKVVDPVVVAFNKLSPWTIALSGVVLVSVVLAQRKRSSISGVKPRKIHSLGTKIPIIGDMLEMLQHADHRADWFVEQSLRFNYEPWQIKIPGTPTMIVLTDPAHVEAVTISQFKNFVKSKMHQEILHDVFGRGLVNAEGEHWHHQRKTAAKFFSARTLRLMMTQTMQRNINLVSAELDAVAGTGELANLTNLFQQFTMQTFLEVGVGIDAPIIGKKEPTTFEAVDEAMTIIMHRRLLPPFVWKLQRWLNIGREKRLKELMTGVYAYVQNLIDLTLSSSESKSHDDENHVRTAIDLFVEHSHEDKVGLRPQDLLDFVLNFVLGARDTSSVATQWFFYALSKHPEVEAKIREELATNLPTLGVDRDGYITEDHVKKLIYLEAVIKETLRYFAPIPFNMREAAEDTIIDGDLVIRKGQAVAMPLYALGRNPRVWGSDANEFRPERWIDEKTGELIVVPPTTFVTFSAGPRICIGLKLAMLNIRVLTANMLHRYKFEIDPSNDGSSVHSVMLGMRHNLLAKVERI